MTPTQLRQALHELNGERQAAFAFVHADSPVNVLTVENAMLIPDEPDHLVKVTDGQAVFVLDADNVAWVRIAIGQKHAAHRK